MPKEIKSAEEFLEISKRASECRIKEIKDGKVKLKLRTAKNLYTLVVPKDQVDSITKQIQVKLVKL